MNTSSNDVDGSSCRPWRYLFSVCRRLLVVESGFRIYFAVRENIRKTPQKLLLLWASGGEQGIRFARLRSLGRSRSQQSTGLLLCTARPSNPFLTSANKKEQTPQGYLFLFHGEEHGIRTHETCLGFTRFPTVLCF